MSFREKRTLFYDSGKPLEIENFYMEFPPIEMYRASIENEVGLPAICNQKG
jgi:hypothetical protein